MRQQETAQRRQVTILLADIVNSTALVDHLDPEDVMGIMQTYLDSCRSIVAESWHLGRLYGDESRLTSGIRSPGRDSAAVGSNAAIRV